MAVPGDGRGQLRQRNARRRQPRDHLEGAPDQGTRHGRIVAAQPPEHSEAHKLGPPRPQRRVRFGGAFNLRFDGAPRVALLLLLGLAIHQGAGERLHGVDQTIADAGATKKRLHLFEPNAQALARKIPATENSPQRLPLLWR